MALTDEEWDIRLHACARGDQDALAQVARDQPEVYKVGLELGWRFVLVTRAMIKMRPRQA